jgi:hypothetical protein
MIQILSITHIWKSACKEGCSGSYIHIVKIKIKSCGIIGS